MRPNRDKYFLTILVATVNWMNMLTAQAQEDTTQLTLSQVWSLATANAKDIQIRQIEYLRTSERVKDTKNNRLPDIDFSGEYARVSNMPVYEHGVFNKPEHFPVLPDYYKIGGEAYLNLYNGGKNNLEINTGKIEHEISGEQKRLTISAIKLQSAESYLNMLRSLKFRALLQKDIEVQEKIILQIKALLKNGLVLKSDVLRAELKLSRQKLMLVTLANDLLIANQKLNILIGLPDAQTIIPVETDTLHYSVPKPYNDYLNDADGHAYQIKVSEQETALSRLNLKRVRANVYPRIGLFAEYNYSYPQIFLYPYSGNLYGFGLAGIKASFSVSAFYKNMHKAKVAKLELQGQDIEHLSVQDKIHEQVNEVYLKYNEARYRIEVIQTNVKQAAENYRIVKNTYFNQTSLITDLLDADTQLLQTNFDLAAADIAAQLQYYQLLHITGKL